MTLALFALALTCVGSLVKILLWAAGGLLPDQRTMLLYEQYQRQLAHHDVPANDRAPGED